MKNSPISKYALCFMVISCTSIPLASVAAVWDYDNAKSVEQPASEAAPPRSGLEGPIRTETMEPSWSQDAGTIYERGQIPQSSGDASPGNLGAEGPVRNETMKVLDDSFMIP
jgi:hypothetical protein